ncbi:MAG: TetR/AcrR family transcriptional regulator [Alphaproteobacteria bacterium]|nr:TetR/AcrR family transcriptional regulator [Alphaproteobacteria bacterium]
MSEAVTKATVSRTRVLDAAARIFRDRGYSGTTMRAIGTEAKLKAGSIYYHFRSKDELIEAVLDLGITTLSNAVHAAIAALPPSSSYRDRIGAAFKAHLFTIVELGDYTLATRRVFGQVPRSVREKHIHKRDAYGRLWQHMLDAAQNAGELRADADTTMARLFIVGALNWTVEWFNPGGKPLEHVANEFADLIFKGLEAQTDSRTASAAE